MTDKQSKEKVDLLKALGAEVIVCPTAVAVDDPRSYHQVVEKLAHEIPNAYHPKKYANPATRRSITKSPDRRSGRTPKARSRISSWVWGLVGLSRASAVI